MPKFNKHIIIVGTARSGTSWLSEIMATPSRYRLLFEPEHETQTKKGHLLSDKWLTQDNVSAEADQYLREIFSNRVDSDWIAQNSNRKFKMHLWPIIPKKFVVKFVRGNLLAHYVQQKYNIPVLHFIRNPYDVITSQRKVKFPWLDDLSKFASQQPLLDLLDSEFNIDLEKHIELTYIEKLTMRWCIENVLPLEVFESYSNNATIVRYETLFSKVSMFYDLCEELNLEPAHNVLDYYNSPSSKTNPEINVLKGNKASHALTDSEILKINAILDSFKTELYPRQ